MGEVASDHSRREEHPAHRCHVGLLLFPREKAAIDRRKALEAELAGLRVNLCLDGVKAVWVAGKIDDEC
eukprot:scaffold153497_cov22-Tisochrysis_lutea.AAC.2